LKFLNIQKKRYATNPAYQMDYTIFTRNPAFSPFSPLYKRKKAIFKNITPPLPHFTTLHPTTTPPPFHHHFTIIPPKIHQRKIQNIHNGITLIHYLIKVIH
jgi:hypothetical protein